LTRFHKHFTGDIWEQCPWHSRPSFIVKLAGQSQSQQVLVCGNEKSGFPSQIRLPHVRSTFLLELAYLLHHHNFDFHDKRASGAVSMDDKDEIIRLALAG
jgi:hypothetical protein